MPRPSLAFHAKDMARKMRKLLDTLPGPDGLPYDQADLARATGTTRGEITHILQGKIAHPNLFFLHQLTELYRISLKYFVVDEAEEDVLLQQQLATPLYRFRTLLSQIDQAQLTEEDIQILERLRRVPPAQVDPAGDDASS